MSFPSILLCFYLAIIVVYCINCIICAIFRIDLVQNLYVYALEKLFTYAASAFAVDTVSVTEVPLALNVTENGANLDETLIERDIELTEGGVQFNDELVKGESVGFKLHHPTYLLKCGIEAIIEDSVTKRFTAAELRVWNFLGRNQNLVYMNKDCLGAVLFLWLVGFLIRYLIFLPCRSVLFTITIPLLWVVGFVGTKITNLRIRMWIQNNCLQSIIRLALYQFSAVIRFHNPEFRPVRNTVCVANHTTPFDWAVLASDVTYAVVGQKHTGFFGLIESIISSALPAVWFDRNEVIDRSLTARKLKQHVTLPNAEPLLIFPEGTCINNTSVMKFKKGCFEVGATIHPVAIKYNPLFADCFWNSSQYSLLQYTVNMLTSWAMVVDVWYLPPTKMLQGEDGIQFARRVQQSIAKCGGLVDMDWDGELKRRRAKDTLRIAQQKYISRYVVPSSESPESTVASC